MCITKDDPIAIIGGGAFGLSTALELSSKGYTNITVFEKDEEIPSRWSAGNDLNKIMRAEYEDEFYTNLAVVSTLTSSSKFPLPLSCSQSIDEVIVGSNKSLADPSIRTLLPTRRLPKCCFWCSAPESNGHAT